MCKGSKAAAEDVAAELIRQPIIWNNESWMEAEGRARAREP